MNHETLDRLLVDRALGGLEPDIRELLDAYLDCTPDAAARAQEFAAATDLARRALGEVGAAPALPPFPAVALAAAARARRRMVIIGRAASLVACLLLGVAVGAWAVRPAAPGPAAGGPPPTPGAHVPVFVRAETSADGGFWSTRRFYEEMVERKPARAPQVEWFSPVCQPRIGGAS